MIIAISYKFTKIQSNFKLIFRETLIERYKNNNYDTKLIHNLITVRLDK